MNKIILCILVGTVFAMTYAKDTVDPEWVKEFESTVYGGVRTIDSFTCNSLCTGIYDQCETIPNSKHIKCLMVEASCKKNCNLYKKQEKEGKDDV